MKKTDEIKKAINGKRAEIERLQVAEQIDDAVKAADELNKMLDEYKVAATMEASEFEAFASGAPVQVATPTQESAARLRNRAFNKLVFANTKFDLGGLTDEEKRAYFNVSGSPGSPGQIEATPAKGGYLVPEEQLTTLREFRKAYTALRDYAHVVQANSTKGVWPTLGEESGKLVKFVELTNIQESDFEFGQATYEIADYGDIIPISNQLVQDANVDIMSIVGQRLARKAVNTENAEILTLLGGLTPTTITGYKNLTKALNVDLDPVYYANARIYTNQNGFQWLSDLEDGQNRPLLVPDVAAPDTYRFRGKQVVVLPNSVLANIPATTGAGATPEKIPFYVGNMADYVMFFERRGVEIAVSTEYLWAKYGTALRCVVRFGVVKDDGDALKAYTVAVS